MYNYINLRVKTIVNDKWGQCYCDGKQSLGQSSEIQTPH